MLLGSLVFLQMFLMLEIFLDGKLKEIEKLIHSIKMSATTKKKLLKQVDYLEHSGFMWVRALMILVLSWFEGVSTVERYPGDMQVWAFNITSQVFYYWIVFDILYNVMTYPKRHPLYIGNSSKIDKKLRKIGRVPALILKVVLLTCSLYLYFNPII